MATARSTAAVAGLLCAACAGLRAPAPELQAAARAVHEAMEHDAVRLAPEDAWRAAAALADAHRAAGDGDRDARGLAVRARLAGELARARADAAAAAEDLRRVRALAGSEAGDTPPVEGSPPVPPPAEGDDEAWMRAEIARARASEAAARHALAPARAAVVRLLSTGARGAYVLFPPGETTPPPAARHHLEPLLAVLENHPERRVLVEGHADDGGSAAANLGLARARAATVAAMLARRGTNPERITTRANGEAQSTASEDRVQNRRVDVVVLPEDGAQAPERGEP